MAILDRYQLKVFFPAPAGERRAQGLPDRTCAIVAHGDNRPNGFLPLIRLVSQGRSLGVVFEGTFGRDPQAVVPSLQRHGLALGEEVFRAETDAQIMTALDAEVESVLLFVADDILALPDQRAPRKLLRLKASDDVLARFVALGPVLIYSPDDDAIEVFASESQIIALINQLA